MVETSTNHPESYLCSLTFKSKILITIPKLKPTLFKFLFAIVIFTTCYSCPSENDDECIKTISVPQFYLVGNQSYSTENFIDVPCDFPEPTEPELTEPPQLENFTYEILSFNYQPDTGNNTTRLQFEIKLNNFNNFAVTGVPVLTVISDELVVSGSYSNNAVSPCYSIASNSNCILVYDQESSLDLGLGAPATFEITNVEYVLTNED